MSPYDGFGAPISNPKVCEGCGNDEAAYARDGRTLDDGAEPVLCLDCLELEDDREDGNPGTSVLAVDVSKADPMWVSPHRLIGPT